MSMLCHRCEKKAAIRMYQHRLQLCREHFIEWVVKQTGETIEKYHMLHRGERILVAVSGGKDSLSLWDVLWRMDIPADGLYINLGIEGEVDYSNQSERFAQEFADQRGLKLNVVNVKKEYGESIPEITKRTHRGHGRPCSVCGLTKRHIMNQTARDSGYDVILTAHNLDDEVAVLFGNVLSWDTDLIRRQAPVLQEGNGFVRKAKPFCRFYERETVAYAILAGIPYIEDECPFAEHPSQLYYKEVLNKMEEDQAGLKMRFYSNFVNAKRQGRMFSQDQENLLIDLKNCSRCGQPTTREGLCTFCAMIKDSKD